MPHSNGLTPVELEGVVHSPVFRHALVDVTRYTTDHDHEAAFAVYKYGKRLLAVSDPLIAVDMHTGAPAEGMQRDFIDVDSLVSEADGRLRRDVAMLIHTHSAEPVSHLAEHGLPSLADLSGYADLRANNPGLIEGVAIAHRRLGGIALLLYREGSRPLRPRHFNHMHSRTHNSQDTLLAMQQARLNVASLVMDESTGELLSGELFLPWLFT